MNINQLDKLLGNVYSLKHQRTLLYKIESGMIHKGIEESSNSIMKRRIKARTQTFIDKLEPIESLKVITGNKRRLTSLYSSRLLPAQYLVTPVEVLNKLTDRVYNYSKKPKRVGEKSEFLSEPSVLLERGSKKLKHLPENKTYSHTVLEKSCKKILEDNKKSRKILSVASQFLSKNLSLTKILRKKPTSIELNGFEKRLKEAHNYLVNLDKIPGLNSQSKLISTQ